ncbi:unnamed protein product [Pseudo-nitzschia multistriata]|uniref:DUF1995 domain-containing protein n=1 Tax=Pseudo-nitzschia multistriata TaxID=183589 RepID=A0A448ZKK8_9STRA|nr:unnamed protein product [Pseudo-nitzschia multistriata]VEU42569.1 unnamed protein product [Pseudo-nitzschia multistriata]
MKFYHTIILFFLLSIVSARVDCFSLIPTDRHHHQQSLIRLGLFSFGGSGENASVPSTTSARDKAAIESCKKAIERPRNADFPLIELEFPVLAALNKLGDGSLRSAMEAEDANLSFVGKLTKGISVPFPLSFGGSKVSIALSSSASNSFKAKAAKITKGTTILSASSPSLAEDVGSGGICIFVSPTSRGDYNSAQQLARSGTAKAVVIVNAFAKDPRSIPGDATMAYFLKPLTYNSQVAGYLIRSYPSNWTVLDATSKAVLGTFSDGEILVQGTNTPDLRASGRIVQKSVDERAIAARNSNK